MSLKTIDLNQIMPSVILGGLLGGGMLIVTSIVTTRGWLIMPTYVVVLSALMWALKFINKIETGYWNLFVAGALTFLFMSYIYYFYVIYAVNPDHGISFIGHLWRFFMLLGLALFSSAIIAFFFKKKVVGSI